MIPQGTDALRAMRSRVSTRSYTGQQVDAAILDKLLGAAQHADHVWENATRVALVSGTERTSRILTFLVGSYGLVRNAPHLLVGILPQDSAATRVDLGYVLEQVVLEATRLGLSSCWIAGSYDAGAAGDMVSINQPEEVAAVCSLGHASATRMGRFHDEAIHRLVGSRRRRLLSDIVYGGRWGVPWTSEGADPSEVAALELCRLAPSAANRQPWRFIAQQDGLVLALARSSPIDAGIVMAHYALAAGALGIAGRWHLRWDDPDLALSCGLPEAAVPVAVFA